MKKNRWVVVLLLWILAFIASMIWMIKPFRVREKTHATDFISDSVLFVVVIPSKDSLPPIEKNFSFSRSANVEFKNIYSLLTSLADTVWLAGYSLEPEKWLWLFRLPTQKEFPSVEKYRKIEKKGWVLLSKNETLLHDALRTFKDQKHVFTTVFKKLGGGIGSTVYFSQRLSSHLPKFVQYFYSNGWIKLSWIKDTSKVVERWSWLSAYQKSDTKVIDKWENVAKYFPAYVEEFWIESQKNERLVSWEQKLEFSLQPPYGYFRSQKDSIVNFARLNDSTYLHDSFPQKLFLTPLEKRKDTFKIAFWQDMVFWSTSSVALQKAMQQLLVGNDIANRNLYFTLLRHVQFPVEFLHVVLQDTPYYESFSRSWDNCVFTKVHFTTTWNDGYRLPPYKKIWVIEGDKEFSVMFLASDSMLYVLHPTSWELKRLPAIIDQIDYCQVFSKGNKQLYVWWNEQKLAYRMQAEGEDEILGTIELNDDGIQQLTAMYLERPSGWRLVYISKGGQLRNLLLSGEKTEGWRYTLKIPSSNLQLLAGFDYYFVKNESTLWILSRTGKVKEKFEVQDLYLLTNRQFLFLKDLKTLGIFTGQRVSFVKLPSDIKNVVGIKINSSGDCYLYSQEKIWMTKDFSSWRVFKTSFTGKIENLYLFRAKHHLIMFVLYSNGELFRGIQNRENFELKKVASHIQQIYMVKEQLWALSKDGKMIYTIK